MDEAHETGRMTSGELAHWRLRLAAARSPSERLALLRALDTRIIEARAARGF